MLANKSQGVRCSPESIGMLRIVVNEGETPTEADQVKVQLLGDNERAKSGRFESTCSFVPGTGWGGGKIFLLM